MPTRITEISDRAACAVWSPFASHSDLVALGTKDSGGVSFDSDKGGELELFDTSYVDSPKQVACIKTETRFSSLLWISYTAKEEFPLGLIAGGMEDGVLHLWDVTRLLNEDNSEAALVASIPLGDAAGNVTALKNSPIDKHMICAGASNGNIAIIDITNPRQPTSDSPDATSTKSSGGVTAVAWNSQVAHIVATAFGDGSVAVWDWNARKIWCEIRAEQVGQSVTDVLWNPSQGLHLLTASGDDRNPVLRVWDLQSSTSMPMAALTGHTAGLLNVEWCPHDDALLLSTAKDQRTILWDLYTMQPMGELPLDHNVVQQQQQEQHQASANPSALFASSSMNDTQHLRYAIAWSPIKRGVALTCSLDRKVQVHSIMSLTTATGRPPAWLKPRSAVSTGFGGILVSCAAPTESDPRQIVTIRSVQEEPEFANKVVAVESTRVVQSDAEFCLSQAGKHPWGFLRVVFEANARQQLLEHLEFSAQEISKAAGELSQELSKGGSLNSSSHHGEKLPPAPPLKRMSRHTEEIVQKALLVGNFEAAVECCFQAGSHADALLLASCGGGELWAKTQERYFSQEAPKRPFLSIAKAIIGNQLDELVEESRLENWRETLAILATYGQSETFPQLCVCLGDRLHEAGDEESASNCYVCALHLEGAVRYWLKQFESEKCTDKLNALHEFVLKVSVLSKAMEASTPLPSPVANIFHEYSSILADQGLLALAAQYSQSIDDLPDAGILRDRLYRSRASPRCLAAMGNVAPTYPYQMLNLTQSAGQVLELTKAEKEAIAAKQEAEAQAAAQATAAAAAAQQQQQQQQQQTSGDQYGQQQPSTGEQLPPNWIALQDPSSGQTYYANEMTGETTWDRPQPAAAAPAPSSTPQRPSTSGQTQSSVTPKAHLMSKYGDGFVTSASHPELANQYGNVGTSNPYGGAARPGTAAAVLNSAPTPAQAPVSGSLNFDSVQLTEDHNQVKDTLLGLASSLKSAQLNPVEKRQLSEAEKGVAILVKKLARGDVLESTTSKVYNLVAAISNADLNSAAAIQTDLANHDWRDHKDWLKGVKILIQLATKKL